jgi:NADH:quinone reductase (non-electrogenic)
MPHLSQAQLQKHHEFVRTPDVTPIQDHACVFAIGDISSATDAKTGSPLPGLGALQAGRHVGKSISQLVAGKPA